MLDVYQNERVAVFMDGSNLFSTAKALGFNIDYAKFMNYIKQECRFVRAYYYTALVDKEEYSPIRPLIDWLDYNGYTLVTKMAKQYEDQNTGRKKIKGNMDIEIAIDMLEMSNRVNHMVLFSGDGDFRRLVEEIKRKGVRVTIVSTIQTNPSMVADEMRRIADSFVDLNDLRSVMQKEGEDYVD
jgi:uncharacterized LabA/DUF88 family protein